MVELFKFERKNGKDEAKDDADGGFFSNIFKRDKHDGADDVKAETSGEKVILRGKVPTRDAAEKMIVATGNTKGVGEVESHLEIEEEASKPKRPAYTMYTVKSGDTLSKIAKAEYGDAMKYPIIFEANQPMLKDPDEIYPGQVLRLPPKGVVMS